MTEADHDWRPAEDRDWQVCRRCLIRDTSPAAAKPCMRYAEKTYSPGPMK